LVAVAALEDWVAPAALVAAMDRLDRQARPGAPVAWANRAALGKLVQQASQVLTAWPARKV
jgi:hypothetical protein